MKYSITQFGKSLDPSLYSIDMKNKTFSSNENNLVLDFSNAEGWTFTTGDHYAFKTGGHCTFRTGNYCTFYTNSDCHFITGFSCMFKADINCIFETGDHCTFTILGNCTFKTGENCVIVRCNSYEVIYPPKGQIILLNYIDKGYKTFKSLSDAKPTCNIEIDGKKIHEAPRILSSIKKTKLERLGSKILKNT